MSSGFRERLDGALGIMDRSRKTTGRLLILSISTTPKVTTKQIIIIDLFRSTYSVPTIDYRGTGRAVVTGGRCCAWYEKGLEGVCALVGTEYGRILYPKGCLSLTGKFRKPSDIQEREVWIVGYSGIRARLRRRSSITPVWVPIGDS